MRRTGEGLSMADVVAVCESLGICPQPGPHGVQIGTTGWRLECGSGIAGRGGVWTLRVIAGAYHPKAPDAGAVPIGPIRTKEQLRWALRMKWPRLPATPEQATPEPAEGKTQPAATTGSGKGELEECGSCRGRGFFNERTGKPTIDRRGRKCLDCRGEGKVPTPGDSHG